MMELINYSNTVVYKGKKEEFYGIYDQLHQLEAKIPHFYCRVVETDEWCYLEISFQKVGEFYKIEEKEVSDRVREFCETTWKVEDI